MAEWEEKWCTQNKRQHTAINTSFIRLSGEAGDAESRQFYLQSVDQFAINEISKRIKDINK